MTLSVVGEDVLKTSAPTTDNVLPNLLTHSEIFEPANLNKKKAKKMRAGLTVPEQGGPLRAATNPKVPEEPGLLPTTPTGAGTNLPTDAGDRKKICRLTPVISRLMPTDAGDRKGSSDQPHGGSTEPKLLTSTQVGVCVPEIHSCITAYNHVTATSTA